MNFIFKSMEVGPTGRRAPARSRRIWCLTHLAKIPLRDLRFDLQLALELATVAAIVAGNR